MALNAWHVDPSDGCHIMKLTDHNGNVVAELTVVKRFGAWHWMVQRVEHAYLGEVASEGTTWNGWQRARKMAVNACHEYIPATKLSA